jgi:hypothetical protein
MGIENAGPRLRMTHTTLKRIEHVSYQPPE